MVRPMVHSIKHYAQATITPVTSASTVVFNVIDAVVRADISSAIEVQEGSSIKAVWMEMWLETGGADQFFTACVVKLPGGLSNMVQADLTALQTYDNKKNILYTTQGLVPSDTVSGPMNIFKGWIKIPKSKQRFGLGDRLQFAISSRATLTINFCGIFIFKEYS